MLGNLLGGFIIIIIGVNLMPVVADSVHAARYYNNTLSGVGLNSTNVTGGASTILGLTPLFFSLGIMSAGVALTVGGMRNAGIM